ncbi:uncharacterized protein B4U80_10848 [Leptotrombidium deliense]|uniref:Uncharacterized protein n=1 Tax=Leptotrombidium deliense TaxID=299467 RepID=A0A443SKY8_9ACAR|nr:uncharacterized protein B4U80_10848 [Leptotrombidium deliense]
MRGPIPPKSELVTQKRKTSNSEESDFRGLTTETAVTTLYEQIEQQLRLCKVLTCLFSRIHFYSICLFQCEIHGKPGFRLWIKECFGRTSIHSTFRWPSVVLLFLTCVIFLVAYFDCGEIQFLVESLLLFICLLFNIILSGIETRLRHQELHRKAHFYAQQVKNSLVNDSETVRKWKTGNYYPLLHLPQSPCITLQWTCRDNKQVNLPATLLVKGDVIIMCPGHTAPGLCRSIDVKTSSDLENESTVFKQVELKRGDIFAPSLDCNSNAFTNARLKKAMKPVKFLMLETPYLSMLKLALEKSFKRPATMYEKERHTIIAKYLEQIVIPLTWIVTLCVSCVHYGYLNQTQTNDRFFSNTGLLLLRPTLAMLPLLPVTLSTCWLLLTVFGVVRLVFFSQIRNYSSDIRNIIHGSPGSFGQQESRFKRSTKELYFDDLDENSISNGVERIQMSWKQIITSSKNMLLTQSDQLWRSANLLQVLGSITILCCVDKKGILSWPNPTADKVCFLTSSKQTASSDQMEGHITDTSVDEVFVENVQQKNEANLLTRKAKCYSSSKMEVLDITHDPHSSHGIQFDDPDWKRFLPNLKPIGLNILLNTCNQEAQQEYTQFCDHITCESLNNEASVPVVNKRCLCELARRMGFSSEAISGYEYVFQISSFRHIKPEIIRQGKLAKSLNIPRLKMPFPNITSAVIKDTFSATYQLFTQGTGDLVLDSCTEFWNGEDLCQLTDYDRKRILDFYQRSSLTATCMAYAYVPLTVSPDRKSINDHYIELPPDNSHLFRPQKFFNSSDFQREFKCLSENHYLSTDSVVIRDYNDEDTCPELRTNSASSTTPTDNFYVGTHLNQLNNEVFIGMVTMQYQACPDFVKMIEQLENACIRFVHFSKENELRSRVFSEKMGLESGWNCHISLLTERPKCENEFQGSKESKLSLTGEPLPACSLVRSQSAPSYVNIETNAVKFENETSMKCVNDVTQAKSDQVSTGSSESYELAKEATNLITTSPSPSRNTESSNADHSAPITFDMSNRAKLPKGIENIRPHLENIDNVPLLVSLFTDCTPETTGEMINIMQENGEIVCVLGSSANIYNIPIFLQADASIGIEPLYPQVCITQPVMEASDSADEIHDFLSPTEVAKRLNTLPCSLSFQREDPVSLIALIMEARHHMMNTRNSLQFLICCLLSLSFAQLCSSLLFLSPLFSPAQILWCVCVVLPLLSFSLMASPQDPQIATIAMGKNLRLNREVI